MTPTPEKSRSAAARTPRAVTSFRLSPPARRVIEDRSDPDGVVDRTEALHRILARYSELCRRESPRDLSEAEWNLLRDSLNGVWMSGDVMSVVALWHGVEDSIRLDHLDEKWGVNGEALLGKGRGYTYAQNLAIVDAVERWWLRTDTIETAVESEWIIADPAILGGKPCVRGTRISVDLLQEIAIAGASTDEIRSRYPQLSAEAIDAALAYDRPTWVRHDDAGRS